MKTKDELSAREKTLFAMTGSDARTARSKRAAIGLVGLRDMTPAQVWGAQRLAWKEFRSTERGVPSWVSAVRFLAHGTWRHARCPVDAGTVIHSRDLMKDAFKMADWGRARKRSTGHANMWSAGVTETDNGKGGWYRVVNRYANYICVMSPDRKKVYYQLPGEPPRIATLRKRCFLRNGERYMVGYIDAPRAESMQHNYRATCRRLQHAGIDAKIVRQDTDMIIAGSGESLRKGGQLLCVVDCGDGTHYHTHIHQSPQAVRNAIEERGLIRERASKRLETKRAELDWLNDRLKCVWVTEEDSLQAGNCFAGTRLFMAVIRKALGVTCEIGAVRGDWLISQRDDTFTRAACLKATERMGAK